MLVKGTAVGLQDEYVWLFDFDPDDGFLYQVNTQPIDVINGIWAFSDAPTGDEGDEESKKIQSIVAVRANQTCNAAILSATPDDGAIRFKPLPAGCVEEDRVRVRIVRA